MSFAIFDNAWLLVDGVRWLYCIEVALSHPVIATFLTGSDPWSDMVQYT